VSVECVVGGVVLATVTRCRGYYIERSEVRRRR